MLWSGSYYVDHREANAVAVHGSGMQIPNSSPSSSCPDVTNCPPSRRTGAPPETGLQTGIIGYKTKPNGQCQLALPGVLPSDMSSFQETSGRSRIVPKTERLTRSSRWLHKIDHYTSQPSATLLLGAILVTAVVLGAILGFPATWTAAFEVGASFVTLMMVVIIQHTQGREQMATQRKLDELLRALPQAESGLMMLEEESDETIQAVENRQRITKQS